LNLRGISNESVHYAGVGPLGVFQEGQGGETQPEEAYALMAEALRAAGKDILMHVRPSIGGCDLGTIGAFYKNLAQVATAQCPYHPATDSWLAFLARVDDAGRTGVAALASPGYFNDMGELMVGPKRWGCRGVQGCALQTTTEYRTQLSFLALHAAPLMLSMDLEVGLSPEDLGMLLNREVVAVNQDKLARQAVRVGQDRGCEIYARPLSGGDVAVGLLNRGEEPLREVSLTWAMLNIPSHTPCSVRDLWHGSELGAFVDGYTHASEIPPHDTVLLRFRLKIGFV